MSLAQKKVRSSVAIAQAWVRFRCRRFASTESAFVDKKPTIVVPDRIERGPTDILKALSATVGTDFTAPPYKYHDDPILTPPSNKHRRFWALSAESGRKAARWVISQHADLFQHREAEPFIEAFAPPFSLEGKTEVTEEDLKKVVGSFNVLAAIDAYNRLMEQKVQISQEVLEDLLGLLAFYNEEAETPEELVDERWLRSAADEKGKAKRSWRQGGLAEKIFESLSEQTAFAYNTMLRGLSKHGNARELWRLADEMRENRIPLDVGGYNALLARASFQKESFEGAWNLVLDLLRDMQYEKVKPNAGTLTAALLTLGDVKRWNKAEANALSLLAEFKNGLGIEPTLSSFQQVLQICYHAGRKTTSSVLYGIIDYLEQRPGDIPAKELYDTKFFTSSMEICCSVLSDPQLANRIHALFCKGKNYTLVGDGLKESIYYRHYIAIMLHHLPIGQFFEEVYHKYIPNVYVPEPTVLVEIVSAVNEAAAVERLPQLWSDIVVFGWETRLELIERIVSAFADFLPSSPEDKARAGSIVQDIFDRVEGSRNQEQRNRFTFPVDWTGVLLVQLTLIAAHCGNMGLASSAVKVLGTEPDSVAPSPDLLARTIDLVTTQGMRQEVVSLLQYGANAGYAESRAWARDVSSRLRLTVEQKVKVNNALGADVLSVMEEEES